MAKNPESLLWNKVKKGLTKCFLTRIESSTINGTPDVHGVLDGNIFWIELKSDKISFPPLNKWQVVWINKYVKAGGIVFILYENGYFLGETLRTLQTGVRVYRSPFTGSRFSFSFPVQWPLVQDAIMGELQTHAA